MYRRDIADLGFLKICDLFSTKENLNPEQGFFIMGIINSMPASWRLTIKRATTAPVIDPLPDSPAILISNNLVPILDASSKQIYRLFLEKKQTTPTAKVKLAAKYSNIDIDWKSVYSLSFHIRFSSTLFKKVRFCNSRTTRADCYVFSCSSGMEGSENVKSNLSFSEESEQDLYDGSLRRKGVRSVYLGT